MASATCELKWLRGLLISFGVPHNGSMLLLCDSQSALHMSHNPVHHERTKHIEVDRHLDVVQAGFITTEYIHTSAQLADILTKALGN